VNPPEKAPRTMPGAEDLVMCIRWCVEAGDVRNENALSRNARSLHICVT